MKQQITNRLGVAHVRDTVMQLVAGTITREQAMESLEIGKTRLYERLFCKMARLTRHTPSVQVAMHIE